MSTPVTPDTGEIHQPQETSLKVTSARASSSCLAPARMLLHGNKGTSETAIASIVYI